VGHHRDRLQPEAAGENLSSWAAVFEPSAATTGKITLLREANDLIACTLIYLGKNPNSTEDADLAEAVKFVRSLKPKLKGFSSDTYIDELAANETLVARHGAGRLPGPGPEPGRQLRHPQGGLAAVRGRHVHPQGRPPSRQRRPLHELRAPSQGAGPHLQVRQLRHPVSLAKPLLPSEQTSDPAIYPPASTKLSIVTMTGQKLQKWQEAYGQIVQ
jgi:spermidine/putrescine transport system substrate-binding protein